MKRDRRWMLQGLASGVAVVGIGCKSVPAGPSVTAPTPLIDTGDTGDRHPVINPGPWTPEGSVDLDLFPYGIQVGDVTPERAIFSVRTQVDTVTIELVRIHPDGWELIMNLILPRSGRSIQADTPGLVPGARYRWVARSGPQSRSAIGTFITPPPAGDSRVIRFGAVSCLGGNEPWPCLSRAAEEQLDLFLFLGDTIYADWGAVESVQTKWTHALAQQGMRDLTASTSLIATWDDHEVWNGWSPTDTPASQIEEARSAFRESLPQRTGPTGPMWRALQWGDVVDFFVLDSRGERVGNDYISRAQMDWIKSALSASTARFKIILNSVPITDLSFFGIAGQVARSDRWQGFPAQRTELVEHCATIPGVLFVSGDFHIGAATRIDPINQPAGDIVEILAGPGGTDISSLYGFVQEGPRIPRLIRRNNTTIFECDPVAGQIAVRWVDNDGADIASYTVEL